MSKNKIFKATFIIMIVTVFTRCLGLIRDRLVGATFGAGMESGAYIAAVSVSEVVFTIVGLAIATTFIPILSEIKSKQGKNKMFEFSNNIITIIAIICICLSVLGFLFTKQIVGLIFYNLNLETMELTILLTKISIVNILLLCLKACFASVLQVCEDFIMPSILGLFFNLPIILYLILFTNVGVIGLTIANVIGNLLSVLVQLPSLYKHGFKIKPFIDLKDERIRRILILILPVLIGAGANSLNLIVDKSIAAVFNEIGGITIIDFAQKLVIFTNVAITTSIVSVMYPLMANKLNSGDKKGFLEQLSKGIVVISLFLIPIMMAFVFLRVEVISLIFGAGEFDTPETILITSTVFAAYALQLPFSGARDILNSSLFSMQKTKITAINGVIGVSINIILSLILSKYIGVSGIAIASSIAAAVTAILLFNSTRKLIGDFNAKNMIIKLLKIALASIIMISTLYIINKIIVVNSDFIILAVNGIIGIIIFAIVCKFMKIEEFDEATLMITKKLRKR
ncbi:murein biosynthesis integral membrane protein MurJ [Clostridium gasigenes]|uniref:murein biosynthesis integral membrane protein MurJ n=1 Tax=Clostridium gasigenes TaxID=94869 RepID=UPI0016281580|nr:murein biosynthesis integral membrane protein MurJ [Clostridium gasigenes]MBB6621837.1 murein biosynthesis integral membrane protein MurJ [Clostridium gasigenes]